MRSIGVTVDPRQDAGNISPLLFGHNLEHTRSAVWQGLGAELLRNRKFYGKPQRNGVALDWYAISPGPVYYELDLSGAYTTHYDATDRRRWNEIASQRIRVLADGEACGIGQSGIPLRGGQRYTCRLALRADREVTVCLKVLGADGERDLEDHLKVSPEDWREFTISFVAHKDCDNARLEITTDLAANLYVGAVSLTPEPSFYGMRPDVVALLREIGCPILRWPGGNFAGDYRWQDALLPVDRRAPLASFMEMETQPHTRGFDCHEIGIDEFIALCREVGAEPFLTINPAWESPELSAAWVEYCNGSPDTRWGRVRAQRGYPEPYGVKYWSLGNELGYGHMEGPNTPSEYARRLSQYAEAMRRTDPSIVLVSSGVWTQESWYRDCLPRLGNVVDLISHHHYTRQAADYAGLAAEADIRRVASAPSEVAEELRRIRANIDAHAPAGRNLGISFDEWNVWWAWYREPGPVEALYTASMLNVLCREAHRLGIVVGCFFQPINEGAITVRPDGAYLTGPGKVFALFKAHWGNTLINCRLPAACDDIDLAASVDRGGRKVVATLANRSLRDDYQIRFRVLGFEVGKAEIVTLQPSGLLPGCDLTRHEAEVTREPTGEFAILLPSRCIGRVIAHLT